MSQNIANIMIVLDEGRGLCLRTTASSPAELEKKLRVELDVYFASKGKAKKKGK